MTSQTPPIAAAKAPETEPGQAVAEHGIVMLDGPGGIAVSLTPDAADGTARSLHGAAADARRQSRLPDA